MFCWVPSHVGIQGNERVDALARLALNEPYSNIKIPIYRSSMQNEVASLKTLAVFLGRTSSEQASCSASWIGIVAALIPGASKRRTHSYTPDTPAFTGWRSSTSLCLLSGTFVHGTHHDSLCRIRQSRWLSGLRRSLVHSLMIARHCVLRNWDRILVRAVKGLISRAGMVSICPLLWQRDVKC